MDSLLFIVILLVKDFSTNTSTPSSFYTHSTSNCPPEQIFLVHLQAQWGLNTVLQLLHHPHLSAWPLTPNPPPVAKPTTPLELSLDLVFPWQHHQWAQSNVSNCLMFPVATVGKHKSVLWNWMLFFLLFFLKEWRNCCVVFRTHSYALTGTGQKRVCGTSHANWADAGWMSNHRFILILTCYLCVQALPLAYVYLFLFARGANSLSLYMKWQVFVDRK